MYFSLRHQGPSFDEHIEYEIIGEYESSIAMVWFHRKSELAVSFGKIEAKNLNERVPIFARYDDDADDYDENGVRVWHVVNNTNGENHMINEYYMIFICLNFARHEKWKTQMEMSQLHPKRHIGRLLHVYYKHSFGVSLETYNFTYFMWYRYAQCHTKNKKNKKPKCKAKLSKQNSV